MVDANNTLHCQMALHNICILCPTLSTKTYRAPVHLFIFGCIMHSQEGATQGDPLAMAMYAIELQPLSPVFMESLVMCGMQTMPLVPGSIGGIRWSSQAWILAISHSTVVLCI